MCGSRSHPRIPRIYSWEYVKSFIWTLLKHRQLIYELAYLKNKTKCIVDEYGEEYTAEEFLDAIDTPIQKQHYGYWS